MIQEARKEFVASAMNSVGVSAHHKQEFRSTKTFSQRYMGSLRRYGTL